MIKSSDLVFIGFISILIYIILLSYAFAADDRNQETVGVELVLLADISNSMGTREKQLQREGYRQAFSNKKVIEAVQDASPVAITYIEYATESHVVVPWRVLETKESIIAFGEEIQAQKIPIDIRGTTNIRDAVRFALKSISTNSYKGFRKIIDVSGDGTDNVSQRPQDARDEAIKANVKINGLPIILDKEPAQIGPNMTPETPEQLMKHYETLVITPNGFMIKSDGLSKLGEAIISKLRLELM